MRAPARRRVCVTAALAAVLVCATGLVAQDKPVYVVDTDPAPAQIEGGTFFLVGGLVATMVRNRHTAPVWVTLRSWVFDQSGRFKGTNAYCVAESLDRGTRRVISAPLDVARPGLDRLGDRGRRTRDLGAAASGRWPTRPKTA